MKGHSNVTADQASRLHEDDPYIAMIPITGGARMETVRPLPPLCLRKQEWETIGQRMQWFPEPVKTQDRWLLFDNGGNEHAVYESNQLTDLSERLLNYDDTQYTEVPNLVVRLGTMPVGQLTTIQNRQIVRYSCPTP